MIIKASIADVLKTEQSFSHIGQDHWPVPFYPFVMYVRTEAKKSDYISMISVPQAIKLVAELLVMIINIF